MISSRPICRDTRKLYGTPRLLIPISQALLSQRTYVPYIHTVCVPYLFFLHHCSLCTALYYTTSHCIVLRCTAYLNLPISYLTFHPPIALPHIPPILLLTLPCPSTSTSTSTSLQERKLLSLLEAEAESKAAVDPPISQQIKPVCHSLHFALLSLPFLYSFLMTIQFISCLLYLFVIRDRHSSTNYQYDFYVTVNRQFERCLLGLDIVLTEFLDS